MSDYRAHYRRHIAAFLANFPPGTPIYNRVLELDRVKPGFHHDNPHKPFPQWKFQAWFQESERAIRELKKQHPHV